MKNPTNEATKKLKQPRQGANVVRVIHLRTPEQCRDAFKNVQVKGFGKITFVTLQSGKRLNVQDMDDEQVVHYANEIFGGQEGK